MLARELTTDFLVAHQKPISLQNDYTTGVTTKISNEPVTGFFLIAKIACSTFDFK